MSEEQGERGGLGQAIYLFCLARAHALPDAADAARLCADAVEGRPSLFLWRREAIVAICNRAPLDEFCGPQAEARLADLAWVGPRARIHAEVIMSVMRQSPVFPVRFGTLFSSLGRLEKLMEKRRNEILRFFDHVEAREEWAVKGWIQKRKIQAMLRAQAPAARGLPPATPGAPAASPGVRYFDQQRQHWAAQEEINLWVKAIGKDFAADLAGHSSDFRNRPVQAGANRDDRGDMMSNWAFLVPRARQALFQERIQAANAVHGPQGVCFECSGPWPPYSFVPSLEADPGIPKGYLDHASPGEPASVPALRRL